MTRAPVFGQSRAFALHLTGTQFMDIGFIGLGNMGQPMARRLIEAGRQSRSPGVVSVSRRRADSRSIPHPLMDGVAVNAWWGKLSKGDANRPFLPPNADSGLRIHEAAFSPILTAGR